MWGLCCWLKITVQNCKARENNTVTTLQNNNASGKFDKRTIWVFIGLNIHWYLMYVYSSKFIR
jgi:hypothetical protein